MYIEPAGANAVRDADVDGALRDAVAVAALLVAGLTGAVPARLGDLRMDVGERQRVRGDRRRLARPRGVAVDAQLQRAEEARLAEHLLRPRDSVPLEATHGYTTQRH